MQVNLCFGCMEPTDSYPCPRCGYTPGGKGAEWALQPGSILNGKYMVGRILGQGGFGITYIGWDIALEKKVAIKEYYPSGQVGRTPGANTLSWYTSESAALARQTGLEMFLKEARKMSKVDDVFGIVRVRDLFQENQTAYIVMDYVEGETLKARLQKTGPMAWDQAKEIFRPAIRAMEQVHKAGLIHRDLSPDNLMLTPDGQVKILDLGAAKDLSINSGASSMQVAKSGFSPFEQYSQRGGSGPWTDVYAMAATIYYTLTGVLPPAAIDRVEEDTMDWSLVSTLPGRTREALRAAMAVSAKKRTQSMEELERGLFEEVVEPEPKPEPKPEPEVKPEPESEPKPDPKPEPRPAPKKSRKMVWAAVVAVAVVLGGVVWGTVIKPASDYKKAQALMDAGQYPGAAIAFSKLGDYQDSAQRAKEAGEMQQISLISAGDLHTVGLYKDGTVAAVGNNEYGQCDVSGWSNIVTVAAEGLHTVGLCGDGTVVAVGWNEYGQCDVSRWSDIVAVAAGSWHTVGLRSDGTVVAVGRNGSGQCDVSGWSDIVAVAAGSRHTVGLRRDGTVVAEGDNQYGQCKVSGWSDIVAVAAEGNHTVGLRSDGTVVAVGSNGSGECDVSGWTDIVAVSAGYRHTVGLRSDGTVVAVGDNGEGRCDVSGWSDIVAVAAGWDHTVGLRSNGTVVAVGDNDKGQCDVSAWTGIRTPGTP